MKKSLLWLSAAMVFILALKAELPELSNYFAGSTQQAAVSPLAGTIRYVTPTGAGSKNGSSWANASDDINWMTVQSSPGDEIWVAAGTYLPNFEFSNPTSDSRDKTFRIKDGVKYYGCFSGTESNLSDRNVTTNVTRLSGDFNADDVVTGCGSTLSISGMEETALFTLVLRAKADAQLSSALSLNRILSAEAYNANNDQLDLAFKFNAAVVSNGFELKQNTPNPFNGETLISGAAQGTVFCF
jgi:hypothetical protein